MITVRAMQVKGAEQVSELERMIFSQPWSYQGFVDSLSLPNTVFLVAEENNKILGYIGMYLSIDEGEITNVAVSPEMRCHGIGGMLLAEAKKEAESRSVGRIVLESPLVRMTLQTVCMSRNGFVNHGVRKGFYELPGKRMPILDIWPIIPTT